MADISIFLVKKNQFQCLNDIWKEKKKSLHVFFYRIQPLDMGAVLNELNLDQEGTCNLICISSSQQSIMEFFSFIPSNDPPQN